MSLGADRASRGNGPLASPRPASPRPASSRHTLAPRSAPGRSPSERSERSERSDVGRPARSSLTGGRANRPEPKRPPPSGRAGAAARHAAEARPFPDEVPSPTPSRPRPRQAPASPVGRLEAPRQAGRAPVPVRPASGRDSRSAPPRPLGAPGRPPGSTPKRHDPSGRGAPRYPVRSRSPQLTSRRASLRGAPSRGAGRSAPPVAAEPKERPLCSGRAPRSPRASPAPPRPVNGLPPPGRGWSPPRAGARPSRAAYLADASRLALGARLGPAGPSRGAWGVADRPRRSSSSSGIRPSTLAVTRARAPPLATQKQRVRSLGSDGASYCPGAKAVSPSLRREHLRRRSTVSLRPTPHIAKAPSNPKAHQNAKRAPRHTAAGPVLSKSGGDLLSQGTTPQVPSAQVGLTSVFGMGTGVSPPLWPPETLISGCAPDDPPRWTSGRTRP